jgi:hypothetical protein
MMIHTPPGWKTSTCLPLLLGHNPWIVQWPIRSSSATSLSERASPAPTTFSRRCAVDDVPGISRMFGDRCSSQASATDIGAALSRAATPESAPDWSGVKPPSGKNGTYGIPPPVDEVVVVAVSEVVHILHAHDRGDALRLSDLVRGGVADPEVADQTLLPESGERLERLSERTGPGGLGIAHAHVDQIEYLDPKGLKVLVDLLAQIFGSPGRGPAALCVAVCPHLGGDEKRLRIGGAALRGSRW